MAPSWTTCRQSSEPIEPPPPVTSTTRLRMYGADRLEVELDLLAAEQILDRDRPDLPGKVDVAGDQLVQARQRLDRMPSPRAASTILRRMLARRGRHRDQHLVGPVVADQRPSSSVVPSTRTPWMRTCFLRGSSSTNPTGV